MIDEGRGETVPGKSCFWLGGLFFLLFLVIYFPADRAYPFLSKYLPGQGQEVALSGLDGSWLSGSAREGIVGGIPVRQIRWAVTGLGHADLEFRSGADGYVAGRLAAGRGGSLTVTGLQARLPFGLLGEVLARSGLKMNGIATAALDRLKFRKGRLQAAEGTLVCSRLQLVRPHNLNLGDFKIEITTVDGEIKALISDGGGPLALHGVLMLQTDGTYSFSGSAAARQDELASVLRLLGKLGADGMVAISRRGNLPPLW